MEKMKSHGKGKKVNIMVEAKNQSWVSTRFTPKDLIDRAINTIIMLKKECKKQNTIYLTKSSYNSLQIALAFSFSKSLNKNTFKVKELMSILSQNQEILTSKQITPILNGFLEFIKQGKENYDMEEALYLIRHLAPLFYIEIKN